MLTHHRVFGTTLAMAWLVTLALLSGELSLASKLDRVSHPVLDLLAEPLDRVGIDVLGSWSSPQSQQTGSRLTLADLTGYERKVVIDGPSDDWADKFEKGLVGAMAAVKVSEADDVRRRARADQDFVGLWGSTAVDRRVFISFAREDLQSARRIKSVLESEGYVVFTYIENADEQPQRSLPELARIFQTAGHRIVLDSPHARKSHGVLGEALAARAMTYDPAPTNTRAQAPASRPKVTRVPVRGASKGRSSSAASLYEYRPSPDPYRVADLAAALRRAEVGTPPGEPFPLQPTRRSMFSPLRHLTLQRAPDGRLQLSSYASVGNHPSSRNSVLRLAPLMLNDEWVLSIGGKEVLVTAKTLRLIEGSYGVEIVPATNILHVLGEAEFELVIHETNTTYARRLPANFTLRPDVSHTVPVGEYVAPVPPVHQLPSPRTAPRPSRPPPRPRVGRP